MEEQRNCLRETLEQKFSAMPKISDGKKRQSKVVISIQFSLLEVCMCYPLLVLPFLIILPASVALNLRVTKATCW